MMVAENRVSENRVSEDQILGCCIPGCEQTGSSSSTADICEPICEQHFAMADPILRARFDTVLRRLVQIQSYWDDDEKYELVVASDRFLKLANATGWASETAEAAWHRVKLDVLKACGDVRRGGRHQTPQQVAS